MAAGPRAPSARQILGIARDYGLDMTLAEAGEHVALMGGRHCRLRADRGHAGPTAAGQIRALVRASTAR